MVPGSEPAVIELEYRGVITMRVAVGARIGCLSGRIWITEERSTDDIVLDAGESFDIPCAGVAVVQALRKAAFAIQAQGAPRPTARPAAPVVLLREPSR